MTKRDWWAHPARREETDPDVLKRAGEQAADDARIEMADRRKRGMTKGDDS